jgi:Arc/MetJ-type ribon-helix-helix transcriptional regulator
MKSKKITVSIPEDLVEWIKAIAVVEGISANDVVRRAIKSERYLTESERSGNKIIIEDSNGKCSILIRN